MTFTLTTQDQKTILNCRTPSKIKSQVISLLDFYTYFNIPIPEQLNKDLFKTKLSSESGVMILFFSQSFPVAGRPDIAFALELASGHF